MCNGNPLNIQMFLTFSMFRTIMFTSLETLPSSISASKDTLTNVYVESKVECINDIITLNIDYVITVTLKLYQQHLRILKI